MWFFTSLSSKLYVLKHHDTAHNKLIPIIGKEKNELEVMKTGGGGVGRAEH